MHAAKRSQLRCHQPQYRPFEEKKTMSKSKHDLRFNPNINNTNEGQEHLILTLRDEARQLRNENNNLVEQLWDIDLKLIVEVSPEIRQLLTDKKNQINNILSDKKYEEKIEHLLEKIIKMETELNGYSKVNSNSPYNL